MIIPKIFWKYYDLFRRKQITLSQFSQETKLSEKELLRLLQEIIKKE